MLQWLNKLTSKKSRETTFSHSVLGSVVLRRSDRARRVSITVRRGGGVTLTLPPKVREEEAIRLLETKVEWIIKARERVANRPQRREYSAEEIETLRRRAKEYLPGRVGLLARQLGFSCGRVTVRATRSRWGSCSAENNISLSLFLMTLPPHLIDYIIIHELCHTVHHNHSAAFHALVDRHVGGREKMLEKELRQRVER